MKILSTILGCIVTLLVLIFAISNRSEVTLAFWPIEGTFLVPLYIAAVGCFLMGFLFAAVIIAYRYIAMLTKIYQLNRKVIQLEATLFEEKQKRFQDHGSALVPRS